MTDEDWKKIYRRVRELTVNVRMRSFLYRMAIGHVFANEDFHEFGYRGSDECSFCAEPEQTKDHLFYDCFLVQVFLQDVKRRFRVLHNRQINGELMFKGVDDDEPEAMAVNWIIAVTNQYIYQANHSEENLSIHKLEARIRYYEKMERNSRTERRARSYELKYQPLQTDVNFHDNRY